MRWPADNCCGPVVASVVPLSGTIVRSSLHLLEEPSLLSINTLAPFDTHSFLPYPSWASTVHGDESQEGRRQSGRQAVPDSGHLTPDTLRYYSVRCAACGLDLAIAEIT